jgi:hypothetical protein
MVSSDTRAGAVVQGGSGAAIGGFWNRRIKKNRGDSDGVSVADRRGKMEGAAWGRNVEKGKGGPWRREARCGRHRPGRSGSEWTMVALRGRRRHKGG